MTLYRVIKPHISEFPDPLSFKKGAMLTVGEKYEGPEGWDNWYFCKTEHHEGGWVPAQIIHYTDKNKAHALQDYTAKELNVIEDEELIGGKILNGWVWCRNTLNEEGWVPLTNLIRLHDD